MNPLSKLEMAVALRLAEQVKPDGHDALIAQLRSAEVSARHFTGVGFFTEFRVDRALPPATVSTSPGGWVQSRVGPDSYPLDFMLYVEDGYAVMIEAFSVHGGYGDIDLLTTSFTEPNPVTPNLVRAPSQQKTPL